LHRRHVSAEFALNIDRFDPFDGCLMPLVQAATMEGSLLDG
jgi:hypothetical protein